MRHKYDKNGVCERCGTTRAEVNNARHARLGCRRNDAGLIEIKVWTHPDEAPSVRNYARKNPLTAAILEAIKL